MTNLEHIHKTFLASIAEFKSQMSGVSTEQRLKN